MRSNFLKFRSIANFGRNLQEGVKGNLRYITVCSLDDTEALPLKGEFFCRFQAKWMPKIPGVCHKQEIKQ